MKITGYDELRTIGRGGFGVVYQGRDRRFARDVAVKVLSGVLDDTMAARFDRECQAVGALSGHPHIVVVHDSGTTADGLVYLVMELLAGGSLADRLASAGPQSWRAAAELGVQLAGALETAHRGGVLHRDVKPENVLFSAYRQPKLVDFGIATVRGGFETKSASVSASLAHAAPEILAGKRASTASDVYALGSTLFQVLTGSPAFLNPDDETLFPLLARIASDPVPDLRPQGVPDAVATVIERSMAKAPADRFGTALEFGLALAAAAAAHGQVLAGPVVVGEEPPPAPAPSAEPTHQALVTPALVDQVPFQRQRGRRRRSVSLAVVALLLVGAGAAYALQDGPASQAATYRFAESSDRTVTSNRTWSLDAEGATLSSDTALKNPSANTVVRTAIEVIPKSVAADVNLVRFTPDIVTVVEADPVVRWNETLAPGQVRHLRWTVQLAAPVTMTDLRAMAAEQRAAERALAPRLSSLANAAGVPMTALVPFASVPDPGLTTTPTRSPPSSSPTASAPPLTLGGKSEAPGGPVSPPLVNDGPRFVPGPTATTATGATGATGATTTRTSAPAAPVLRVPGTPLSVRSGTVRILTHVGGDPMAEPTSVSVGITWSAPSSGGAPSSYCVRWTLYAGTAPAGTPSRSTCVTGRSVRITVPHVNPADSWLRWEVLARNSAGASGWGRALAVVPDLVNGRQTDGVDQLRAAGLRVNFDERSTSDTSLYCRITGQSPRSGSLTGSTYVLITYYVCN